VPLTHSALDSHRVENQLGRTLRGSWTVARRCHLGFPMVIENHPLLEDGTPFPTLYWLTCPILLKRVSRLEAGGEMAGINRRLEADTALKSRLDASLHRLVATRDALAVLEGQTAPPGGGPDKVKCLHAHVAQELADPPNPVGAWALSETGWPDCVVGCVREPVS
jgi:uncharacterized protein